MDRERLLGRVGALLERTQGIAFIVPEDTGHFSIDDEMVRRVHRLIDEAVELMSDLTDFYDAESAAHGEGDGAAATEDGLLREIGAQISSELAAPRSTARSGRSPRTPTPGCAMRARR